MKELAQPALENVMNDNVQFYPSKFKNTYKHWMENIKDWCISRQLWWGHRIPAYFYGKDKNDYVVAANIEDALKKAADKLGRKVKEDELFQDEDVMDTWLPNPTGKPGRQRLYSELAIETILTLRLVFKLPFR